MSIRVVVLLAALAASAPPPEKAEAPALDHPRLGEPAPAFTLPSLAGQEVSLTDYEGKFVVLHFGAGW